MLTTARADKDRAEEAKKRIQARFESSDRGLALLKGTRAKQELSKAQETVRALQERLDETVRLPILLMSALVGYTGSPAGQHLTIVCRMALLSNDEADLQAVMEWIAYCSLESRDDAKELIEHLCESCLQSYLI